LKRPNAAQTYDPEECHKIFFGQDHINKEEVILTKISDSVTPEETNKMFRLEDIVDHWDYLDPSHREKNRFYTQFMVFKVCPEDLRDAIVLMCHKCKRQTSLNGMKKRKILTCPQCHADKEHDCEIVLLLELYVKDKTTLHNSKFWRVVVMMKQEDQFFGDFKLQSLWKDEDAQLKIEQLVQAMTRYNVWVKTILTK